MKLSIIIPVYNGGRYIEECLNSVISNDLRDYEIIVINDGSTDNTTEILSRYKIDNLKIINNSNHGVSFSRNAGIDKANGDYIMFLDADDRLKKEWYEIVMPEIYSSGDDIIYFSTNIENSADKEKIKNYIAGYNNKKVCLAGPFSKAFRRAFICNNQIKFKRNIINGEDMLFNFECIEKCSAYKIVNKQFYEYRLNVGSATRSFNTNIIESDKQFYNEVRKILNIDIKNNRTIVEYLKYNSLVTIFIRLAYIKYKEVRKYLFFLKEKPYCDINFKNLDLINIGIAKRIIILLILGRLYYIAYLIIKINNKIDNIKTKDSNSCFVEI